MPVMSEQGQQYLSVVAENDIYAPRRQDRHYSNGVRIAYGLSHDDHSHWVTRLGELLAVSGGETIHHTEFALGQNIYTPEYYVDSAPQLKDRPYAGWLYGELSVNTRNEGMAEDFSINIGIVGPLALGEPGQKLIHSIIDDPKPAGWDNQLRNEPALLARYRRSWFIPLLDTTTLQAGLIPRLGVNIGNVFTDVAIGTAIRIGKYLPLQDVPLRIQPGLSVANSYIAVRRGSFDWMLYAEVQGRAVAHNIFLDGNTFANSQSVAKRRFVQDLATGITLGFGQFSMPVFLSFSLIWRGREFDLQNGEDNFGSAMIGIQY